MVLSASSVLEVESNRMDSKSELPITGIATFSSKFPVDPAQATVWSFPITLAQTISTASGITGLTLPGIIEDPGCKSGMESSPSPAFGPDPIHRRSLLIFVRLTARTRRAPEASTRASLAPWASKWSLASVIGSIVAVARSLITACGNPLGVLMPVPTAVPPRGTSATLAMLD